MPASLAPSTESPGHYATVYSLEAVMLLTVSVRTLGADGAGCRVNDAAADVGPAGVWASATIEITFDQSGCIMPTRVST